MTIDGGATHRPEEHEARASDEIFELVYGELKQLAARALRHERADHTLQPTALSHEAYLRLVHQREVRWSGRTHFLAIAAIVIRRILLQHERHRRAVKRGAGAPRVALHDEVCVSGAPDVDLLALDDGLTELARLNERASRVVELQYFGGLPIEDTARVLGVSPRTVKSEGRFARAWLRGYLTR